ncbi:MAG: tRNA (adenosine(37)-N6)-dimethylallyltransferase MiaA [Lachnospiraceae bacterium]|uniref:tRNA dimethylallyltransferase n=1 Tax=Candidatus Weimeria bifida TaxID=2599074 RepID=A0A6N7IYK4_9FIRM|nr:tRNA (adenosine(37)-N6)-dimethylallyltransferase MiaA [Candidatus Weimeria bifida]RRF95696.1 MAG: tRNA (adenosine(37)-N6)-dimethylallyltransferase MiaA [Lachnospiraceae bacterium]
MSSEKSPDSDIKKKLIIIAGPTAVGKSECAVALAEKIGGAVISADSMQVYRGMDIGTAKITPEEMQGVEHFGIDILDPEENYDVTEFVKMAHAALDKIYSEGKVPILCGGTGFYIQALAYDIDFGEEKVDYDYRKKLSDFAETNGNEALHEKLSEVDPESAKAIPSGNVKRVIRALEYYKNHGEKISSHNLEEHQKKSPYDLRFFVLTDERQKLYDRIDARVDKMMEAGFLSEARRIYDLLGDRDCTAAKAIGYRELFSYFKGECTLETAVSKIKQDTRHFAKRQLTWFRRYPEVIWIDRGTYPKTSEIVDFMADQF